MEIQMSSGPEGPRCIYQPHPVRRPHGPRTEAPVFTKVDGHWVKTEKEIQIGPIEAGWRTWKTYFPGPVMTDQKPAPETVKALDAIDKFISRADTIQTIRGTCCCAYHADGGTDVPHKGKTLDLETNAQELLRHGISVISSSPVEDADDDDTVSAIIAERHLHTTPYAVHIGDEELPIPGTNKTVTVPIYKSLADAQPYVARIEWEKYVLRCTDLHRISLDRTPEGAVTINSTKRGHNALGYAPRLKRLLGKRTMEQLENDRARVHHYGAVGSILYGKKSGPTPIRIASSTTTADTSHDTFGFVPDQSVIWTPFEECDHSNSRPNQYGKCGRCNELTGPVEKGPKELGFYWLTTECEPPETKLWPITLAEIAETLRRKLRLRPIELRWVDEHPEAYDTLAEWGLVSAL